MLTERRDMLENGKHGEYKKVCIRMGAIDEKIMADVLEAHLDRIGVTNENFSQSLLKHMGNPDCLPKI
jgi:hypothetical protein